MSRQKLQVLASLEALSQTACATWAQHAAGFLMSRSPRKMGAEKHWDVLEPLGAEPPPQRSAASSDRAGAQPRARRCGVCGGLCFGLVRAAVRRSGGGLG